MGGTPLFALNVAGFPSDELPLSVLCDILRGGTEVAEQANIPILGGHTIIDKEPKYGMVVTGKVEKQFLTRNNTAKANDVLVLTKPLGTGIISTAIKHGSATKNIENAAIETMVTLNRSAANAMKTTKVSACTDVTGYGLLGHLLEMCEGSNVSAEINFTKVPFIDGVIDLALSDVIPGGTRKNLEFVNKSVEYSTEIQMHQKLMLADAQTSGGLLISISPHNVDELIQALKSNNTLATDIIGKFTSKRIKSIYITQ